MYQVSSQSAPLVGKSTPFTKDMSRQMPVSLPALSVAVPEKPVFSLRTLCSSVALCCFATFPSVRRRRSLPGSAETQSLWQLSDAVVSNIH